MFPSIGARPAVPPPATSAGRENPSAGTIRRRDKRRNKMKLPFRNMVRRLPGSKQIKSLTICLYRKKVNSFVGREMRSPRASIRRGGLRPTGAEAIIDNFFVLIQDERRK